MTTLLAGVLGLVAGGGMLVIFTCRTCQDPHRQQSPSLRRGYLDGRVGRRQVAHGLIAIAVAAAVWLVTGWPVGGLLAGLAIWVLPRLLGRNREHERRVARIEAIAAWTEMLRDTLASAAGLEQAITATASLAPPPIRGEIQQLALRLEAGQRLGPSLRALADQLADPTADLVISALLLASEQRARRLGELLGSLAQVARSQAAMRMRVEAGRARTRTSLRVIVGTTLAFAIGLVVVNRDYLTAYDSTAGQLVLLLVGWLFAVAFAWMAEIARPVQPARFLAGPLVEQQEGTS